MILFDGAFGTLFAERHGDAGRGGLAALDSPGAVLAIHREYLKAGARAVKTNTFSANSLSFGDAELYAVLRRALELANEAAGEYGAEVFADIGGAPGSDYAKTARLFLEAGARGFIFETLSEIEPVLPAINLAASAGAKVYVSFAVSPEGFTRSGLFYRTLIKRAMDTDGVAAAGLNCGCGPAHMLELIKSLKGLPKPLIAMPNAGYAHRADGEVVFRHNAEYFAQKLLETRGAGAEILGGCCGTTPEHIRWAFAALNSGRAPAAGKKTGAAVYSGKKLPVKRLLVEVDPPMDGAPGFVIKAAASLKAAGISAVTLADSPLGKARADSVLTAAKVKSETGADVIPHIACRDRNRIAIKAALLGASMFGIDKILAVTGDPVYEQAGRRVFEFNSRELISYAKSLNADVFAERPFEIGAAINVNAINFPHELERARRKAEAGASFFLSQPIFGERGAEALAKAREALNCRLFAGVLPVAGYKNAMFLNNEVSGIEIPGGFIEALREAPEEDAADLSVGFASDIIRMVYDKADGFYIMTPLKRLSLVKKLIAGCFEELP
jgi:homocysteine S-methyltransferase